MKKLQQVLDYQEKNYILPFFWQHGEEESVIRHEMQKVNETGIKAVCVESRPHPDFVGDKWWEDLDIIMDEARKRDMKVWVLDDSHFPTGYAVGRVKKEFPQLQKLYLKVVQHDFVGPKTDARILVKWATTTNGRNQVINVGIEEETGKTQKLEGTIVAVIAAKRLNFVEVDPESLINITEHLKDGIVYWDMPEGDWRIFTLVQTFYGGELATEGYLNPILPEATQVLIDTVYEAHYNRYKDDFGATFAGFFSDEPRFGNAKGPLASIGRFDMVLPWRTDMQEILQERLSTDVTSLLPLLWVNAGDVSNQIRYEYMNTITQLYADNFTGKLGSWCREHGVEYIGHVIEDNNAHARLGYGAGHFYRSLWEQDMSGIDVVLHQIMPGMDQDYYKSFTSTGWDGEFFHYGLAKMGSSLGHMDPKKKGRTMCEMYGAYGWGEGIKLMKWLTDHMLVRGVNYFVPHAFSPKEFPDLDCPPHFYANGHNPQYRYMSELMNYLNRMSHLLSDGTHIAPVAVMYHGEAEWSGEYMLFQKPARELMQHQIDFDVVSPDVVLASAVQNNKLVVNKESFSALIIPYSEALPSGLLKKLVEQLEAGLRIIFINQLPTRSSEGIDVSYELTKLQEDNRCLTVSLDQLVNQIMSEGFNEITISNHQPYLRYYHYQHNDGDVYMFFNEDPHQTVETTVSVPLTTEAYVYDAFANKIIPLSADRHESNSTFTMSLQAYESKVVIFSEKIEASTEKSIEVKNIENTHMLNGTWKVSLASAEEYPHFSDSFELEELTDLSAPEYYPNFSGTVRYELDFSIDELNSLTALLSIDKAYEVTDVWLNNEHLGVRVCPPYKYDISDLLKKGRNTLVIEITNTLANQQQDFLSQYLLLEPTGIVGTVCLEFY